MEQLDSSAIKTYRYLRLGMVVLVVVLAVSILLERLQVDPGCWQTSISAYYYTPVQAVLVGTLIAIGVALITVKGSTSFEDIVLNLAGMFAPVVALVPTSHEGTCMSVEYIPRDAAPLIDNNVSALAIGGAVSLLLALVTAWLIARRSGPIDSSRLSTIDRPSRIGLAIATGVVAGGVVWYFWLPGFDTYAHSTAAIAMFVCIGLAAANSARSQGSTGGRSQRYRQLYWAIVAAMVVGAAVILIARRFVDWHHGVLWLEALEIALFAAFWAVQTVELWNEGMRRT